MVVGQIKDPTIFDSLSNEELYTIQKYIESPMTATTLPTKVKKGNSKKEIMTAEVLYARMFAHSIPMECQKWHLNRLSTLIKVCDLQNSPPDKMSKKESTEWVMVQNEARKAKYNTRG